LRMRMKSTIALVCFALLVWVAPASAQSTYPLKISHHRSVEVSRQAIDKILASASRMLKKAPGHVDRTDNVACRVTFSREGPLSVFASRHTPAVINTEADVDAVHSEPSDIKVVEEINFCKGMTGRFAGCSWPNERRSIIVTPGRFRHLVWAHEFGHLTGLKHRGEPRSLMTICPLAADQVQVSRHECDCFLSGMGTCMITPEPPAPHCER
jgi:hypothetical protein